jgi:L-lactate dehydrogenase complex protein LldF
MSDTPRLGHRVPLPVFSDAAAVHLANAQLRANLSRATGTIRRKRSAVTSEVPHWEDLRDQACQAKDRALANLDPLLDALEESVRSAGGIVHRAADAEDANRLVVDLASRHGIEEVVKVKSITTDEIGLNLALRQAGIEALETDLAELIIQLAGEAPSHVLVPAIHKNRREIRDLFRSALGLADLSDHPEALAEAARLHLRSAFLQAGMAVSGANFAVASSGTVGVVESEGNGRMCLTLPRVLVTIMGIEKVLASWEDLGTMLQVLPRSATGERMNPYTTLWTGVTPGDGPEEFHLILLDNGRRRVLADPVGRQALRCIRCSACMNSCPVYERTGGHAYSSPYPGPIGAILTPQLLGPGVADSLPFASSLCGACRDVCPVKIDIPEVLLHLRGKAVEETRAAARGSSRSMDLLLGVLGEVMARPRLFRAARRLASRLARGGVLGSGGWRPTAPGPLRAWTLARDMPLPAPESFGDWWAREGARVYGPVDPETPRHPATGQTAPRPRRSGGEETGPSPSHRPADPMAQPALIDRLEERLADYGTHTRCVTSEEIPDAVRTILEEIGAHRVVVPTGLSPSALEGVEAWSGQPGRSLLEDRLSAPLDTHQIDGCGAAVSDCTLAMAETGTIILVNGRGNGRRVLTLLPDHHLCLLPASAIVGDVPDAIPILEETANRGPGALTLISGPSATSDIELERVEGVHGPRNLHVFIVTDA